MSCRTEYFVNDKLERTEKEVRPDHDMFLRFNMLSSHSDFRDAYSSTFQRASSSAGNKTDTFNVDYVQIKPLR